MNPALTDAGESSYRSLVPARMDRLPWTRFHTRLVIGLGVSWILDGLEIQLAAQVGTVQSLQDTLHLPGNVVSLCSPSLRTFSPQGSWAQKASPRSGV